MVVRLNDDQLTREGICQTSNNIPNSQHYTSTYKVTHLKCQQLKFAAQSCRSIKTLCNHLDQSSPSYLSFSFKLSHHTQIWQYPIEGHYFQLPFQPNVICKRIMLFYIILHSADMSQNSNRKYSKISSALKYYFFYNLYYQCLDIREAAQKCKINYSTAKLILKDLTPPEKKCIKKLIRQKEKDQKEGMNLQEVCTYIDAQKSHFGAQRNTCKAIQIISTVGYDFFATLDKK